MAGHTTSWDSIAEVFEEFTNVTNHANLNSTIKHLDVSVNLLRMTTAAKNKRLSELGNTQLRPIAPNSTQLHQIAACDD
jgi:hypothetical protein